MKKEFSYDALWWGFTAFIILSLAFILPLVSNDYWWYLRLGGEIFQTHAVPAYDSFSYTQAGAPFFYQSWLSALVFWFVHIKTGIQGVFILRAVILWITYSSLWIICRKMGNNAPVSSLLVLLAALAGSGNWSHRPQLLVYPLFAAAVWLLWPPVNKRHLFWLPLIALLWVNLHGSFVLLFALAGAAWLAAPESRKPLGWALLAALVATLLNPHGLQSWGYIGHMLTNPSGQHFSVEWQPPSKSGWQMEIYFIWLLVLPWLSAHAKKRWQPVQWLWLLGFGWLALSGTRYIIWHLFLLAPLTAWLLAGWQKNLYPPKINPRFNWTAAIILPALSLLFSPGVRTAFIPTDTLPVYWNTPQAAVAYMQAHPELPANLWADLDYSSYLVYVLPERPVWIDTRFELYPTSQWETYRRIVQARYGWEEALQKDQIRTLLLAPQREPDLITALDANPHWRRVYHDDEALIYVYTP